MNFFKKNFSTILFILTILCFGGYLYFILSPKIDMAVESQKKIDSLNKTITLIESEQLKLDSHITKYNSEVEQIDDNILKIKTEKTIIREIFHEKIDNVNHYNITQLDSFFTSRYGEF